MYSVLFKFQNSRFGFLSAESFKGSHFMLSPCRFEIVLNISDEEILIPSQLPDKKPEDLYPHNGGGCLERLYRMPCIPHGFWSR